MKRQSGLIALAVLGIVLLIATEISQPRPLSWRMSLSRTEKAPFGTYILWQELGSLFPEERLYRATAPPYELMGELLHQAPPGELQATEGLEPTHPPPQQQRLFNRAGEPSPVDSLRRAAQQGQLNYILFDANFQGDSSLTKRLLWLAEQGNEILIASNRIFGQLNDTLGFEQQDSYSYLDLEKTDAGHLKEAFKNDSMRIHLTNPALDRPAGFTFRKFTMKSYYNFIDTNICQIVGYNQYGHPNLLRVSHGTGHIYLSSVPLAFTNFSFLEADGQAYTAAVMSYLPERNVTVWDDYLTERVQATQHPLSFVLNHGPLRMSWYLLLGGVLLYLFFMGKRWQRPIPVIRAPQNATLNFVQTLSELYLQREAHASIARKRIQYFLYHIRQHYNLDTQQFSPGFLEKLARRSGVPQAAVEQLFQTIQELQAAGRIEAAALSRLNRQLEHFYARAY
jgi:hypothetical protein